MSRSLTGDDGERIVTSVDRNHGISTLIDISTAAACSRAEGGELQCGIDQSASLLIQRIQPC
jgi:hypothetical protein